MSVGASPKTPLGELTALPRHPIAGFKGVASRQEGSGREGRTRGRGEEGKGKERGMGKGGKRGKLGNSTLVVGGIDAPGYTV